jgi:hypothetical protein
MQRSSVTWNEVLKKEAKGLNDFSLGEVQSVGTDYVLTEKGTVSKHHYYIPKSLVRGFDGKTLWFNVSESQAETDFKRDNPPTTGEYVRYSGTTTDTVPMI